MNEVKEREYDICHKFGIYSDNDCLYCTYYNKWDRYKQKDKKEVVERSKK